MRTNEFKKSYIKKVDKYLSETVDTFGFVVNSTGSEKTRLSKSQKATKKSKDQKPEEKTFFVNSLRVRLPSIEGFAKYIKVSRKSLYNWAKEKDLQGNLAHPDFVDALEKIRDEQKTRLVNMGLSGDYNSTIAKLILSSDHGMVEKIDATSGGEPINTFNDDQIDRIAERIASRGGVNGGVSK